MSIVCNEMKEKCRDILLGPSLQGIEKGMGVCVCEEAIVANQITSKSENEPTTFL